MDAAEAAEKENEALREAALQAAAQRMMQEQLKREEKPAMAKPPITVNAKLFRCLRQWKLQNSNQSITVNAQIFLLDVFY